MRSGTTWAKATWRFYDFGVADPTISENVRRAKRFAAMYIGEDPEAPNWDPAHKVIRSPMNSSQGPWHDAPLDAVKDYLHGGTSLDNPAWKPRPMDSRASLYPIIKDLEFGWWDDPERADEIIRLFNHIVLNGDLVANLSATGLVTNAYLYTGEEKYKKWVLEYVEVWMERIRRNGGIIPDNVGPTGKIGEHRDGNWWGGLYGWHSGIRLYAPVSFGHGGDRVCRALERRSRIRGSHALSSQDAPRQLVHP